MSDNLPARDSLKADKFILFQSEDGSTRIEVRFGGETVWLSLKQMAKLFQRGKSFIPGMSLTCFKNGCCGESQLLQVLQQLPPRRNRCRTDHPADSRRSRLHPEQRNHREGRQASRPGGSHTVLQLPVRGY